MIRRRQLSFASRGLSSPVFSVAEESLWAPVNCNQLDSKVGNLPLNVSTTNPKEVVECQGIDVVSEPGALVAPGEPVRTTIHAEELDYEVSSNLRNQG